MKTRGVLLSVATLVVLVAAAPAWAQHAQYYILDGYGGVHSGDGAPIITSAPYFGWDIARDITYVPVGNSTSTGDGMLVLDGFGGAHPAGALVADPPGTVPPYFGFDIARAIVSRDIPPRIAVALAADIVDISVAAVMTTLLTVDIWAPVDGYVHVTGGAYMACSAGGASNQVAGTFTMQVDGTTDGMPAGMGYAIFPDCTNVGGLGFPTDNQALSTVFSVTAGQHTLYLLGRKDDGTGTLRFVGRSLTAQFIAQDSVGDLSAVALGPATMPAVDPSALGILR